MAKKKKKKLIIIVSLVVVLLILIIGKQAGLFGKDKGTEIETQKASMRKITEIISANGKVEPVTEVKISPNVSGEIVELNIVDGQHVEKGDLLLKIKPDVYESIRDRSQASLSASRAQKEQIEVQLKLAVTNLERNKQLYNQQAITQSDYDKSVSEVDNLRAQLQMAKHNIESSQAALKESLDNLQKTIIYAPMSGTVSQLNVELGESVVGTGQMAGTEMLRIADLTRMEAKAEVNENDIVRVSLGDTANIEIDAYNGKIFKGIVTEIANTAKATTSVDQVTNFEVIVFILPESYADLVTKTNPAPLRPGMSCTVDIITDQKNCLTLPIQAVTLREKNSKNREVVFMYKADSSIVVMKEVKTGIQDTKYIEVSGIDSTETIVSGPYNAVSKKLEDRGKAYIPEKKDAKASKDKAADKDDK